MKKITVDRLDLDECTIGRVTVPTAELAFVTVDWAEEKFWSLELPDRANQVNRSCVPYGTYKAVVRMSPSKQYLVLELLDVPMRNNCQFHMGTTTDHTAGCALIGNGVQDVNNDNIPDVTDTKKAFERFMNAVCDGDVREGYECLVEFR